MKQNESATCCGIHRGAAIFPCLPRPRSSSQAFLGVHQMLANGPPEDRVDATELPLRIPKPSRYVDVATASCESLLLRQQGTAVRLHTWDLPL